MALYPCVACGFLTFERPIGSYDICPICGWEDDHVQAHFPGSPVGANHESLFGYQQRVALKRAPVGVDVVRGFRRAPNWRPLREEEARLVEDEPQTGRAYFEAAGMDDPPYYWSASDASAS